MDDDRPLKPQFDALCRLILATFNVPAAAIFVREPELSWIELASGEPNEVWMSAITAIASRDECHSELRSFWIGDETPIFHPTRSQDGLFFLCSSFGQGGVGRVYLFDNKPHLRTKETVKNLADISGVAKQILDFFNIARTATEKEAEVRLLTEMTTDTIVRGNLDGVRLYISPSVRKLLGYEPEELVGRKAIELTHPDDLPEFLALMQKVKNGTIDEGVTEQRQRHKNGSWVWLEAFVRLIKDRRTGEPIGYISSVRGVGQRKMIEADLERRASYDTLTNLPNRQSFDTRLREEALHATSRDSAFSVLFMDVDRFKWINDKFGHQTGDAVLREAAARFRSILRTEDFIARLGGDEFTAIIRNADQAEAEKLARRLIASMNKPFKYNGTEIVIGLSIGIASANEHSLSPEQLLYQADTALYAAKAAGRNTYQSFYDSQ